MHAGKVSDFSLYVCIVYSDYPAFSSLLPVPTWSIEVCLSWTHNIHFSLCVCLLHILSSKTNTSMKISRTGMVGSQHLCWAENHPRCLLAHTGNLGFSVFYSFLCLSSGSTYVLRVCPLDRRLLRTLCTSCRWYGIWLSMPITSSGSATKATFSPSFTSKKRHYQVQNSLFFYSSFLSRTDFGRQSSDRHCAVWGGGAALLSLLLDSAVTTPSSL